MNDYSYKKEWAAIDSLILVKGLPKTALKKVNVLYADARAKGLNDHAIKALLYRMKLESEVNDSNPDTAIKLLKKRD